MTLQPDKTMANHIVIYHSNFSSAIFSVNRLAWGKLAQVGKIDIFTEIFEYHSVNVITTNSHDRLIGGTKLII